MISMAYPARLVAATANPLVHRRVKALSEVSKPGVESRPTPCGARSSFPFTQYSFRLRSPRFIWSLDPRPSRWRLSVMPQNARPNEPRIPCRRELGCAIAKTEGAEYQAAARQATMGIDIQGPNKHPYRPGRDAVPSKLALTRSLSNRAPR